MKKFECWLGRTAYQIVPDRFYNPGDKPAPMKGRILKEWNDRMPNWKPNDNGDYTNDYFYGGTLKGIEEKLGYLKNLGFDLIYMTPIDLSSTYHHYDVGDQSTIDPWLGTWDDFKSLCESAHKLDILIMVDLVFNHTGVNSKYFNDPRYAQWYKKDANGNFVNWWNFKELVEVDTRNKDYQETMVPIVESYLDNGADGFRLDLGEILSPEFLRAIQSVKTKYPDTIFVGEMWDFATNRADKDEIFNGELDSVMNYPMADAVLRWVRAGLNEHFSYTFNKIDSEYSVDVKNVLLNNIGTHDTPATLTMLKGDKMNEHEVFGKRIWDIEGPWRKGNYFDTYGFRKYEAEHDSMDRLHYMVAKELTKIALTLMYVLPGIPCVYYGTEIGETGYKDPFNRKPYDWSRKEEDMLKFVSRLGTFRKANRDILADGKVRLLKCEHNIMVLERYTDDDKHLYIALNRTSTGRSVPMPEFTGRVENTKVVFSEENAKGNWLPSHGILIVRKN